jgi:hypothetical protein
MATISPLALDAPKVTAVLPWSPLSMPNKNQVWMLSGPWPTPDSSTKLSSFHLSLSLRPKRSLVRHEDLSFLLHLLSPKGIVIQDMGFQWRKYSEQPRFGMTDSLFHEHRI